MSSILGGFYRVDYRGHADRGTSAFALANGNVAGLDAGGGIYRGKYTVEGDRIRGVVELIFEVGGELVTGVHMQAGEKLDIPFDIPADKMTNVHGVTVQVGSHNVNIQMREACCRSSVLWQLPWAEKAA